jgi:hypothetical protein
MRSCRAGRARQSPAEARRGGQTGEGLRQDKDRKGKRGVTGWLGTGCGAPDTKEKTSGCCVGMRRTRGSEGHD